MIVDICRCSTKTEGHTDVEYKSIIQNLLEDWLQLLLLPEWPAAEGVIYLFSQALKSILHDQSALTSLRQCAVDWLGNIAARVRKETVALQSDRNEPASDRFPSDMVSENERPCICGRPYDGQFMIACDRCGWWQHGICVGIDEDSPPDQFLCTDCAARDAICSQEAAASNATSEDEVSDQVGKVLVLNSLTSAARHDPAAFAARRFYLCQWSHDEAGDRVLNFCKRYWDLPDPALHNDPEQYVGS